ncbi:DUF4397 domain-containing protein [Tengunoibacter tsumagoiensis]|uniref:DUF4397 domain-containing protein n=1 Tax=Tengunoibacter tsumagoiensis TaxID=2014871 RepID=A0A401ZXP3_9CHLR|nr:DUF4397 domain-containing protein [Tengunoibacter tsumagoiensis]GCE11603.1 hypothetical protein KTT_14620 [Tengunoibacter tsumagoiensis]
MIKKTLLSLGVLTFVFLAFFANIGVQPARAAGKAAPLSFSDKVYPTYVVHGIPGVPVDVYVNKKLMLSNFQPGTTAGPFNLPTGFYVIALYPVGANPATTAAIVNTPVGILSSLNPTSIVARLDGRGKPTLQAIQESNDFVIFPGEGMVAVRDASNGGFTYLQGCVNPVGTTSSFFPTVGSLGQYFRAGQYEVRLFDFGATDCSKKPLLSTIVTVTEGVNINVYAVGDKNAGTLQVITSSIEDEGNRF